MADKPTVKFEVRAQRDPINNVTIYVPAIVDRNAAKSLATVIENAIDRGLIVGVKPSAASGIATGLCEQLFKEFKDGNAVNFDGYFYGRLYLDGTVNADGRITSENSINIRLVKGAKWALATNDFSFTNIADDKTPNVEFLISACTGAVRGKLIKEQDLRRRCRACLGEVRLRGRNGGCRLCDELRREPDHGCVAGRHERCRGRNRSHAHRDPRRGRDGVCLHAQDGHGRQRGVSAAAVGRRTFAPPPRCCSYRKGKELTMLELTFKVAADKPSTRKITLVQQVGYPDNVIDFGGPIVAGGENLQMGEGDTLKLELYEDGQPVAVLDQLEAIVSIPTAISFANRANTSRRPDGDWYGKPVLLTATIGGEEVRHWVTFYDPYA